MAQDLTVDNVDDIIRNTLRNDFNEIKQRLQNVERMMQEDLQLDKNQKGEIPDSQSKLDHLSMQIDSVNNQLKPLAEMIAQINRDVAEMKQKINEIKF